MAVEVVTRIKFKEWNAPNFAILNNAISSEKENHTIPVAELDAAALEALARAWLDDLYGKCAMPNPFRIITPDLLIKLEQ